MSWQAIDFGSVCRLTNGKAYKEADWSTEGIPIIRIQNLNDPLKPFNYWAGLLDKQVVIDSGDLLLAWSGTPGTSFGAHIWNRGKGVLNQHIFRVELNNSLITTQWAKFTVNHQLNHLIDSAHGGVGLKHVTKGAVEGLKIPLPPLPEQKRIASILDKADALREKRRQAIAKLDELLQSVFLDMFGDPVTNPKGWDCMPIGEAITSGLIIEVKDGNHGERHPKIADFCDIGLPFITANCIHNGKLDISKAYKLPKEWLKKLRVGFAKRGDALLSTKGTIGEVAIVPHGYEVVILSPQVTYYRPSGSLLSIYLVGMFGTNGYRRLLEKEAKQSTRAYIGITRQKKLPIVVPHLSLQNKFATVSELVNQQIMRLSAHQSELDNLFSSLQQRAFKGEL